VTSLPNVLLEGKVIGTEANVVSGDKEADD